MKQLKTISSYALIILIVTASFSQCSSAQKLQDQAPMEIGQVYYQKWIAGVQGGGSGVNIFIPTENSPIKLDSVYFRGKAAKLEIKLQQGTLYIGRFKSGLNQRKDIVMSNEPNAEHGNQIPTPAKNFPFELKENECVVSYRDNNTTKYFIIENITEKEMIPYPSAPPNRQ